MKLLVHKAVRFSNGLYGSNILCAYEVEKGITRPVFNSPAIIPEAFLEAQNTLRAKRKLVPTISSKSPKDVFSPGDLVYIYFKQDKQKRSKCLSPLAILDFDRRTYSVTVLGANGRTIQSAV